MLSISILKMILPCFILGGGERQKEHSLLQEFRNSTLAQKKQACSRQQAEQSLPHMLHAGFLLSLCFDPEDGGNIFLHNIG
jgi:hypothetical protein